MFGSPSFEAAQAGPSDEDDGTPTAGLRSEPSSPLFLADDDDVDEDEDEEEEEEEDVEEDDEEEEDTKDILPSSELDPGATAEYVFESQPQTFRVAPHGGFPQDESVSDVRKRLYEKHVGGNDPPVFSYWMYKTKACWTKQGLGMCVYEWRPQFVECNRVALLVKESSSIMK